MTAVETRATRPVSPAGAGVPRNASLTGSLLRLDHGVWPRAARNRPHRHLLVFALILAAWLPSVESGAQISALREWVTPSDRPLQRELARRGRQRTVRLAGRRVLCGPARHPMDHLLGLAVTEWEGKPNHFTYPDFFGCVVIPTRKRSPS